MKLNVATAVFQIGCIACIIISFSVSPFLYSTNTYSVSLSHDFSNGVFLFFAHHPFGCWVRGMSGKNQDRYHGEFLKGGSCR